MKDNKLFIHPILFALYPILELYFKLSSEILVLDVFRPLFVAISVSTVLWLLLRYMVKNGERAAFIDTLIIIFVLYYGAVHHVLWDVSLAGFRIGRHEILIPFWFLILAFLGSPWVWQKFTNPRFITLFLNITSATALTFSILRFGFVRVVQAQQDEVVTPSVQVTVEPDDFVIQNITSDVDIYYIILDGYGRNDVLSELYTIDNQEFLDFLDSRGFYIANESQANYIQTALSLASSLNLGYLASSAPESGSRLPLMQLINQSRVRQFLEQQGYQVLAVDSGYGPTKIPNADSYLTPSSNTFLNQFEAYLITNTPLVYWMDKGDFGIVRVGHGENRALVTYAFEQLVEVPQLTGPEFVFFHIISPHPPFVLDRNGNFVDPGPPSLVGFLDGDFFRGSTEDYTVGYYEKLLYTNQQMQIVIDAILDNSATPPVIIVQADHGPGALLNWTSPEQSCLWERTSILNAYYIPGVDPEVLYPSISPVNSFRVVFNTLFDTQLPLLEDRSYYSPWARPYQFVELGPEAQTPCTLP